MQPGPVWIPRVWDQPDAVKAPGMHCSSDCSSLMWPTAPTMPRKAGRSRRESSRSRSPQASSTFSIGTSQLTQSNFGEEWDRFNGGGVLINSSAEYSSYGKLARFYQDLCGTKNIPQLAAMHEETLNICWYACPCGGSTK